MATLPSEPNLMTTPAVITSLRANFAWTLAGMSPPGFTIFLQSPSHLVQPLRSLKIPINLHQS